MGDWQPVALLLQSYLDQWAGLLSEAPLGVLLAAGLFPIVIGAFARLLILALGCGLLAVLALFAILAPSHAGVTLATAIYFSSLIVALGGIVARRKARAIQNELDHLRGEVNRLLAAEEKRYLAQLRER